MSIEDYIEAAFKNKNCSVDDEYGKAFEEMIRTEFLKGLWHKASEEIPYETACIVITKDNAIKLMSFNKRFNSFLGTNDEEPYENIDKYCYVIDILPDDDTIKFKFLSRNRK